ncbi:MAG TPA: hypothetical protein VLV89_10610 [Candidatus Acidoferrum sp.]|nr:hypothetical protein [Candidatus Acidoferrum sp.]
MATIMTKPMETLREWDGICREFGCSDAQMRELYSAPCPDSAPATPSFEDVMDAIRKEEEKQLKHESNEISEQN